MPKILKIKDNIVTLSGKSKYKEQQYYKLSKNTRGLLLSATVDEAKLLVIGDPSEIKVNSVATLLKAKESTLVYDYQFGKIITPFGEVIHPADFNIPKKTKVVGERKNNAATPEILDRVSLSEPLDTGLLAVDALIPIGKGQRELIIGDRNTGKTSIALNAIINQSKSDTKIIYVAIGQKRNSIISTYNKLRDFKAIDNTIVIYANPDSSAQQFLAPKIGMEMAEAIAYQGNDVLVVIDDLTKHANVYREVSLSIGRNPGREAYPTDIFYQHSSLLERAGKFGEKFKNGSITCLPIVETVQGDIASLIPSNVISITDGQIFTSTEMFNSGNFPAINIQLSVSRTGSSVQSDIIKEASKNLKADHAKLSEIKKFSDMSVDVSIELERKIERWNGLNNILLQFGYKGYSRDTIAILIEMYKAGAMGRLEDAKMFSTIIQNFLRTDKTAKMIAEKVSSGKIEREELDHAIKCIFVPLAKAASGVKNELFSIAEMKKLKGGK